MFRSVGHYAGITVPLFLAAFAVGCTQDPPPNTGYNAQPGYGPGGNPNAPPGYNPNAPPGYNNAPPPGYNPNAPPPGYNNAPPPGYNNAPPPAYNNAPPPAYNNAPPPAYNPTPASPGYTPAPSPAPAPAPGATPAPAPTLPGGFPWPFPAPGTPPGGTAPTPAPGTPAPSQGSTGAATPIDPNFASVATGPLMIFSQQEAPGMQRDGQVAAGNFKEGQILEQPIQMLPGKCYTVLAVGAGVQEVDITLVAVTPIPQASPVLAQDNGSGSNSSLGGRGNCFKWSFPFGINAKYVIKATHGQGIIASQLYSK